MQLAMGRIEAAAVSGSGAWRRLTDWKKAPTVALALTGLLFASEAAAQFGNVCQTNVGACLSNPSPLGSACACFTTMGPIGGIILGGGGAGYGYGGAMASPICRTFRGVCQIPGVAPVGTPCNCYGDPGQISPP
jgi:hypothetical protein